MNQDVKALWTEDLRANPELQGFGVLEYNEKFCCLGRLCLLAIKNGVKVTRVVSPIGVVSYDNNDIALPQSVMDWAELDSVNPELPTTDNNLANANDIRKTFAEIADMIDTYL